MPGKRITAARSRLGSGRSARFELRRTLPVALFRAAHPKQALLFTAVVTVAAAMAGRSGREVGLVAGTVLVGQAILGWHNDLVDRARDRDHGRDDKPVAAGHLDPSTLAFTVAVAVLAVIPLSIANGVVAGLSHLGLLAVAFLGNQGLLRHGRFSFLTWMISFALVPAFLSYGGWAGDADGGPPTILMTVLAALLGLGVHVLRSLPGLVDDNADGFQTFPLRIGLKTGAPRLLAVATAYVALVSIGILVAAPTVGLVQ